MDVVKLILFVAAFVLFVLAGIGIPGAGRFNLVAFGLACWVLTNVVDQINAHG